MTAEEAVKLVEDATAAAVAHHATVQPTVLTTDHIARIQAAAAKLADLGKS